MYIDIKKLEEALIEEILSETEVKSYSKKELRKHIESKLNKTGETEDKLKRKYIRERVLESIQEKHKEADLIIKKDLKLLQRKKKIEHHVSNYKTIALLILGTTVSILFVGSTLVSFLVSYVFAYFYKKTQYSADKNLSYYVAITFLVFNLFILMGMLNQAT